MGYTKDIDRWDKDTQIHKIGLKYNFKDTLDKTRVRVSIALGHRIIEYRQIDYRNIGIQRLGLWNVDVEEMVWLSYRSVDVANDIQDNVLDICDKKDNNIRMPQD